MRMLIQLQLSNYDKSGNFILECDSGWQMVMGRVREIRKLVPNMRIDVLGPKMTQLLTAPAVVNPDIFDKTGMVTYLGVLTMPNALATRYDFDMESYAAAIGLSKTDRIKYDWVYMNDPMQLRNFKAMFHIFAGYQPKFAVHSHFIDNPGAPKFPLEASLWLGQLEAAIKADINFWQCQSAFDICKEEAKRSLHPNVIEAIVQKSYAWDDGYSSEEANRSINESKLRFDAVATKKAFEGKTVIFVPNRIGGRGRSSDYTNCGKFMFDILPQLYALDKEIVVLAGNPSQKFSNQELIDECGKNGFMNLVPDSLRREEYLWVARNSHLVLGLYDQDSYGGTAARECIDLGCLPVWLDNYEYASIAREWWAGKHGTPPCLAKTDFSDLIDTIMRMSTFVHMNQIDVVEDKNRLKEIIKNRCSYEKTTMQALHKMSIPY